MAEEAKITLTAPGSTAVLTTRDPKQADNLVSQGWARVDENAPAKKTATPKTPAAKRAPAAKKAPAPAPVAVTTADTKPDDGSAPALDD